MAKKLAPIHPAHLHALRGLDSLNWRTQHEATEAAAGPKAVSIRTLRTLCKKRLAKADTQKREIKPGSWDFVEVFRITRKGEGLRTLSFRDEVAPEPRPVTSCGLCEACGLGDHCNMIDAPSEPSSRAHGYGSLPPGSLYW